jgi:hypothetical protein
MKKYYDIFRSVNKRLENGLICLITHEGEECKEIDENNEFYFIAPKYQNMVLEVKHLHNNHIIYRTNISPGK